MKKDWTFPGLIGLCIGALLFSLSGPAFLILLVLNYVTNGFSYEDDER